MQQERTHSGASAKRQNVWWRKVGAPYADLKPGMIDAGPSLADGASAS